MTANQRRTLPHPHQPKLMTGASTGVRLGLRWGLVEAGPLIDDLQRHVFGLAAQGDRRGLAAEPGSGQTRKKSRAVIFSFGLRTAISTAEWAAPEPSAS